MRDACALLDLYFCFIEQNSRTGGRHLTKWRSRAPSKRLSNQRPHNRQMWYVLSCWYAVPTNGIDFSLSFSLPLRVVPSWQGTTFEWVTRRGRLRLTPACLLHRWLPCRSSESHSVRGMLRSKNRLAYWETVFGVLVSALWTRRLVLGLFCAVLRLLFRELV